MTKQVVSLLHWRLTIVLATLSCGAVRAHDGTDGAGPANDASRQVWKEARRILDSIESTEYLHKTAIDEERGDYRCDCSGLAIYILNRTVAKGDPRGPLGDGRARPRAMHFYEAFAAAETHLTQEVPGDARWLRVERVVDARPGDIIAWRREVVVPGNSGHVVIVDAKPVTEDDGLVRVVMIDSTTRPQVDDTRKRGESGVGRGTMWLKVDEDGRPVAYVRGSRDAEPVPVRISIGRALEVDHRNSADEHPHRRP
jgi:hypothetical protein